MKRLFCISLGIVLVGCSASDKYDFDLSCERGKFKWLEKPEEITYACIHPFFNVLCVSNTVKYIDDERYCTTFDGKSVRIEIVD
jgi:hypothetical protein